MLQLGKTGYIVRSGRVIGDLWYRWHVLDRSRPILFELQDLCDRPTSCQKTAKQYLESPPPLQSPLHIYSEAEEGLIRVAPSLDCY